MTLILMASLGIIHIHILTNFHIASYFTFGDMNYFPLLLVQYGVQTESEAYELTVQFAQVGSKKEKENIILMDILRVHVRRSVDNAC